MNTAATAAAVAAAFSLTIDPQPGYTLELLPSEFKGTWPDAMAWAKEQGGDLPTRAEMLHLYERAATQFRPDWYWTNQQHADDSAYAWYQNFGWGGQNYCYVTSKLRARAVRRAPLQPLEA